MDDRRKQSIGIALALSAALLWGISGAVAADAFSDVSPARVAQARALQAAMILLPLAWWRGELRMQGMAPWLVALGVNLAAVNVTFYWALERLGVGPGATIQFLGPILVLGWMVVVQHRVVSNAAWWAAVLAVIGVGLVSEAWDVANADWVGVAAGLAAAVSFAGYLLIGEHVGRKLPAVTVMAWGFVFASVFWAIAQPWWSFPTGLDGAVWGKLIWVGIAGTAIPFLLEIAALQRAASGIIGVVATAEPVIGATAAWIMLGQQLSVLQIVGGLMVVVAVASIQRWGLPQHEVPYEAAR
ncbi:MAG: EamA family transporter [Acidimicrobiia bacterium]|nr:EamA family transporter [Acidimicrobiia bacterium]